MSTQAQVDGILWIIANLLELLTDEQKALFQDNVLDGFKASMRLIESGTFVTLSSEIAYGLMEEMPANKWAFNKANEYADSLKD